MERGGVEDRKGMGGQAGFVMVQERGKEVKLESPTSSYTHTYKHPVLYPLRQAQPTRAFIHTHVQTPRSLSSSPSTTNTCFHSHNQTTLCKCALTFTLTLKKIVRIQNDMLCACLRERVGTCACVRVICAAQFSSLISNFSTTKNVCVRH